VLTPFPHQIKRKTAPNSSNKERIRLQEFPHSIFLFHSRLLTRSANLRVASTSLRSQPCFDLIVWIPHFQVTLLVQKGVGTPFQRVPTALHLCLTYNFACTPQATSHQILAACACSLTIRDVVGRERVGMAFSYLFHVLL